MDDERLKKLGRTAKNYLNEKELHSMGQLVSGYLDFTERQAERETPMMKKPWSMRHLNIGNINNVQ